MNAVFRYFPSLIIALAVVLAPVLWHLSNSLLGPKDEISGIAVDSGARIELEMLRERVDELEAHLASLQERADRASTKKPETYGIQAAVPGVERIAAPNTIIDAYAQLVLIAERRSLNKGLTVAAPGFLEGLLGRPADTVGDECQDMTDGHLRNLLVVEDVGPITVRVLRPAVDSLRAVFDKVRAADQDLYDRINTSGSLCVRRIRGSVNSLSSHAFGLALDLNINDRLDNLADGKTQLGLTILADFFQAEGWIWGAAFSREDSMHFEVSKELLERWRGDGLI